MLGLGLALPLEARVGSSGPRIGVQDFNCEFGARLSPNALDCAGLRKGLPLLAW